MKTIQKIHRLGNAAAHLHFLSFQLFVKLNGQTSNVSFGKIQEHFTFMIQSFEMLKSNVDPRLALSVSICREVMFPWCNDGTDTCSIWADLEGKAEGSDAHPLEKPKAQDNAAESSVYLLLSGPRLSPVSESKWSSFIEHVRYVHVPDSVEEISDRCFCKCRRLSVVVFGEESSVKRMGVEAFMSCGFTEIHIPRRVEQICDSCFFDCGNLRSITFHEQSSLKQIGKWVFSGGPNSTCPLTEIYIPDSVEELGDSCFYECTSLSRIIFGPQSSLKRLGCRLFFGVYHNYACSLMEIRIPDQVEEIGDSCFYSCPELSQVIFGEHSSLKVIGQAAFSGDCCSGCPVGNMQIPNSVERLCCNCFAGCGFLSCVRVDEASVLTLIGSHAFSYCAIKEIRIPDTVKELGAWCFQFCPLERVTFGESPSLKRICIGCFFSCSLVEFSIPKSVEVFDGCVFAGCPLSDGVTCVENPQLAIINSLLLSSVIELSVCCPTCGVLSEVVIPEYVEYIGDSCFFGYEHLSNVTFSAPSTVKRLGQSAFHRCGITELLIPSSVMDIGKLCFSRCKKLVRVAFSEPSELKRIGRRAFNECTSLEEIHIPDGVEYLSKECFFECQALHRVTFGESSSLIRIGANTFAGYGASDFSAIEINIPDSVEEIGAECFGSRRSSHVTFGESSALKRVHCDAFCTSVRENILLPPAAVFFGETPIVPYDFEEEANEINED